MGNKRFIQKVATLSMVFTMLSPMFLSAGVAAVEKSSVPVSSAVIKEEQETKKKSLEPVEKIDENNDHQLDSSSDLTQTKGEKEEKEDQKETNQQNVEPPSDVNIEKKQEDSYSSITKKVDQNKIDSSKDEENAISESIDNEAGNVPNVLEEYYSAEETREKAMEMLKEEQGAATTYSIKARSVSKTQAFINAVSSHAVSVANAYGLYPSVMLAQAALESAWGTSILAYNPNFNLFGIKGSYNGQSFSKHTKEYSEEKGWEVIKADFKKYPSYNATFTDYADKLTKGPDWNSKNGSWNKTYYSGSWRKNAKTYKDATKALVGKYATDPNYNTKLDSIIQTYDLTRFDSQASNDKNESALENNLKNLNYDAVSSTIKVTAYPMYINGETDGIYTAPKGTDKSKVVSTTAEYLGKKVIVTEEKKTKNGLTWVNIKLNGKSLGWIDKKGLSKGEVILSEKDINYSAIINRKSDGINTRPWGTENYKLVAMSSNYLGREVRVTKEAITPRATWALISLNGKELGWIDKAGLDIEKVTSTDIVNYTAYINRKTDGINTKPWGTEGYKLVEMSSQYYGKSVKVTKEATTRRGKWALISLNGKELGWIDTKGLKIYDTILSEKPIEYVAKITRKTDGINTRPWGTIGYNLITMSSDYLDKEVKVTKEAVTSRATWAYISIDGIEGWIDKAGLDIERVTSTKNINYTATINRKSDGINTKPWGTEGYELIAMASEYLNKDVTVTQEAQTRRGTWALISIDGKELGWIDKKGLKIYDTILSEKTIKYVAKINRKTDGINTKPWGTAGYKTIAYSSDHYGKNVTVTKEAVTPRATWAYISVDGIKGWIDKKSLDIEKVISTKNINYQAKIARPTDGINTVPWGTENYKLVAMASKYLNKEVKVTKEAVTSRATWSLISVDGKELGWIDKRGLDIEKITSQTTVNYKARIVRSTDGINTQPWGTEGYRTTAYSKNYLDSEVTVKKEAKTRRATWALIVLNGKELGWIDAKALKKVNPFKRTIVIDAGHGGHDSGANAAGVYEKNLNLAVAKKVQTKLQKAGYEVLMTRSTDVFISLNGRANFANKAKADIFVSIHTNAGGGTGAKGIETYSYDKNNWSPANPTISNNPERLLKSDALSKLVQSSMLSKTGAHNRGTHKKHFAVIRETAMPAILTEIGFVDNSAERANLKTNAYQEKLANGIVDGINQYFTQF